MKMFNRDDIQIGNYAVTTSGEICRCLEVHTAKPLNVIRSSWKSVESGIIFNCDNIFTSIEPLPLTKDILSKIDVVKFTGMDNVYYIPLDHDRDFTSSIMFYCETTGEMKVIKVVQDMAGTSFTLDLTWKVQFLHQLQNLFQAIGKGWMNVNFLK